MSPHSPLQLPELFAQFDLLHDRFGSRSYTSIYGAGKIERPQLCLIFMNPTARNISASKTWTGIKAPWLGTKHVWKMLYKLGLLTDEELYHNISTYKPDEWTEDFCELLYKHVADNFLYITNIAKCTQDDARKLPDTLFKEYRDLMLDELDRIQPVHVVTFGNQVSSILLQKPISVSKFVSNEYVSLTTPLGQTFRVYPTYYPVGQGMRNMDKAIKRIDAIFNSL